MQPKHLLHGYGCLWLSLVFCSFLQSAAAEFCSVTGACCVADQILFMIESESQGFIITPISKIAGAIVTINNQDKVPMLSISGDNLILTDTVDYENKLTRLLEVELLCIPQNAREEKLNFIIQIENVNDNLPKFNKTSMDMEIGELFQIGLWTSIVAQDADGGLIAYSLEKSSTGAEYFKLKHKNQPEINLAKALDYEKVKNLQLILYANDQGIPPLKDTATVTINIKVLDEDNQPPSFQPCKISSINGICINAVYSGHVTINEAQTGPLTLTPGPLYALDGDKEINAPIKYEIIAGNENNYFKIDSTNGNITLSKPVDTLGPVILTVMAYQENDKYKYATTSVTFKVAKTNNSVPVFAKQLYTGQVMLNSEVGSFVLETGTKPLIVQAKDADYPSDLNPSIVYEISPSDNFRITNDGLILIKTVFSTPGEVLKFKVTAQDTLNGDMSETNVEVTVDDATTVRPTTGTGPTKPTNQPPGTGPTKPTNQPPGTGPTKPTNHPPGTGPTKPTNQPPDTGPTKSTNQPPGTGPTKPTNQPPGTGLTSTKAPIVSPGSSSPQTPAPGSTSASATTTATTTVSGGSQPTKPPTQPPSAEPTHTGSTTLPQSSTPGINPTGSQSSTTKSPGSAGTTTTKFPGPGPDPGPVTGSTTSSSGPTYHPTSPGVTPDSTAKPGPPDGTATGSTSTYPTANPSHIYGVKHMVALGVPLAILLLIALIIIAILLRKISKGKMEWKRIRKLSVAKRNAFGGSSVSTKSDGLQFVNEGYLEDEKPSGLEKGILKSSWKPTNNVASTAALAAVLEPKLKTSASTKASEKSKPQNNNSEDIDGDGDKEVKSILTKERKSDEGYKAVWFKEDIDPEAKEERVIETGDDDDAEEMEEDKPGRNRGVSFAPEDDNNEQSYQL